ncbi:unnamed protein product, partial [marine sediment metagenome]
MKKLTILFVILVLAFSILITAEPALAQTWHVEYKNGTIEQSSDGFPPWDPVSVCNNLPSCTFIRLTGSGAA